MSATSSDRALLGLVRVLDQQVVMLLDAAQRPDVDFASLSRSAFELVVHGAREIVGAAVVDAVDAEVRAEVDEFVSHARQLELATRDARVHLHELAEGWVCASCGQDVPSAPRVVGAPKNLVVDLACRACGSRTALASRGRESFERLFGPLVGPAWNAAQNGFVVGSRS